ncbi:hypothetical protein FISHEDRAFT_73951 [Fistulina hepatica ATCC 64428]|uniref:Uncharacterized protein n=1 Tax=Fistulina hepatica ATCC 64428 TaxID=1128425 RepID=A0A0D7ABC3_9AGAR|nr:hypothetical protein FISHEDRAFT_73951 [Fistulina hepatica ATCC 64428]
MYSRPQIPVIYRPSTPAAPMQPPAMSPQTGAPTSITVEPGASTYTTSVRSFFDFNPDTVNEEGRMLYHPFKAIPASYRINGQIVSGIQWVPTEAQIIPEGTHPGASVSPTNTPPLTPPANLTTPTNPAYPPGFVPSLQGPYPSYQPSQPWGLPPAYPLLINPTPVSPPQPSVPSQPYIAHNPFSRRKSPSSSRSSVSGEIPPPASASPRHWPSEITLWFAELGETTIANTIYILQQTYLLLLLRLPALYFSRVQRVLEHADLSKDDVRAMATASEIMGKGGEFNSPFYWYTTKAGDVQPVIITPILAHFRKSWTEFMDTLIKEYKILNLTSALLVSAVMTMFQVESAMTDPITRTTAFLALICALLSLLYGCMYMIRFATMHAMDKAASWAKEAQRTKTYVLWNVWVLLAMPAIWLTWSIFSFIVCVMSFMWRTTTPNSDIHTASTAATRGIRIAITCVLALGMLYLLLMLHTFRRYGNSMDKHWAEESRQSWPFPQPPSQPPPPDPSPSTVVGGSMRSEPSLVRQDSQQRTLFSPVPPVLPYGESFGRSPSPQPATAGSLRPTRLADFDPSGDMTFYPGPTGLKNCDVHEEDMRLFDMRDAWNGWIRGGRPSTVERGRNPTPKLCPEDLLFNVVQTWNLAFFLDRHMSVVLGRRERIPLSEEPSKRGRQIYSVYLVDIPSLRMWSTVDMRTNMRTVCEPGTWVVLMDRFRPSDATARHAYADADIILGISPGIMGSASASVAGPPHLPSMSGALHTSATPVAPSMSSFTPPILAPPMSAATCTYSSTYSTAASELPPLGVPALPGSDSTNTAASPNPPTMSDTLVMPDTPASAKAPLRICRVCGSCEGRASPQSEAYGGV